MQDKDVQKERLLLHSCCGPCSTAVIERLISDYDITVFFYNPNIDDREEYLRRKTVQKTFLDKYNKEHDEAIKFIEGEYEPDIFHLMAKGLESEKEGGKRCTECFRLRLERTAREAKGLGFPNFGTTLTVSPHKDYLLVSSIGKSLEETLEVGFLDMDFKKKDGYRRSVLLSKEYGLYRQNHCGCSFAKD